jgi:hypothetical protein
MIWISKRKLESKRKIDDKYLPNAFYTIIIPEIVKEASNPQRKSIKNEIDFKENFHEKRCKDIW